MRIVAIPAVLAALLVVTACSSGPHAAPGHAGSGAGHTPSATITSSASGHSPPSALCRLLASDIAADFGTSVSAVESAPCSGHGQLGSGAEWDLGNVTQPSIAIMINVIPTGKPHPLNYWSGYKGTFSVQGRPAAILVDPDTGITTLVPHGNVGTTTTYTQIQFNNDTTTKNLLAGAEKFTRQAAPYYAAVQS